MNKLEENKEEIEKKETELWFNNPNVLVNSLDIWPMPDMNTEEKYNAISRLIIILTILGYIASQSIQIIIVALVALGIIVYINMANSIKKEKKVDINENYVNNDLYDLIKPNLDKATSNNPFSNVMVNSENDKKIAAPAYNKAVKDDIKKEVLELIKNNNTDNSDIEKIVETKSDEEMFDKSLRNFYSVANTQIPNDQKGFMEFCYGDLAKSKI